jgi:hypothetical protein
VADAADQYDRLYTEKLWALLPAVYRAADSASVDEAGPLREMVVRIGAQGAVLRRSIDRLWQDQSIESCDDWVIAYLGDLLATNLVTSLDARGQRLDVAKTIYYRRRKGTVALLEELAADITGWDARVIELFRRLGRTRHLLDPELGDPASSPDPAATRALIRAQGLAGKRSGTPAGGFADLRNVLAATRAHTAFDETFHTADVRRGRGATGWHDIPRLGVFLWRLRSLPVTQATPVQDATCPNQFTFDPTGRDVPLFAESQHALGDRWVSPEEAQLPGPIDRLLLEADLPALYAAADAVDPTAIVPNSFGIFRRHPAGVDLIDVARVAAVPGRAGSDHLVDPERGRLYLKASAVPSDGSPLRLSYHYGFASNIGAGPYDRRAGGEPALPAPVVHVAGGSGFDTALGALAASGTGTVRIDDFLTYDRVSDLATVTNVVVAADNHRRPLVRLDPATAPSWTLTGSGDDALLRLDGLFLSGGDLVLGGTFDLVTLSCCTLDPGEPGAGAAFAKAADGRPLVPSHLRVAGHVRRLVIDRSIVGPIVQEPGGRIESLVVTDSIVHATGAGAKALQLADGEVTLSRCTVLGPGQVHRLHASDCILHDVVTVDDSQRGCLRFTAWASGSTLPRKYRSVEIAARAALFTSRLFARPGYAQLRASLDSSITSGADDGSEMGAFGRERNPIKERSLVIKLREYMPVGLEPVIVLVT